MSSRTPRAPRPKRGADRPPGTGKASPSGDRNAPRTEASEDDDAAFAVWLGERLRRLALGATAALVVSRAYWPSEPDFREEAGGGLIWVFALLIVAGLAIASALIGGRLRFRASWTDLAVIALTGLVAASARYAIDVRPGVNLAFEWAGFGLVYLLARNLPRTRGECSALAGALAATAVAVAVFGLYQVGVELPQVQVKYLANREAALRTVGIEPGTPAQALYESRLLGSNEPYSTFALANSLAGFLVGPLAVMLAIGWSNLTRPSDKSEGSRWGPLLLAAAPIAATLVCLVFTKSRSAYLGLMAALLVLAWRESRRVRWRTLLLGGAAALLVAAGLVTAGLAMGRLDAQVLTESSKSLGYRFQYWVGAWRTITETPAAFWRGHGPGNFSAPYARHRLPEASEDIQDPHNFVLEVWAAGGVWAAVALAATVGLGSWNLFGPSRRDDEPGPPPGSESGESGRGARDDPGAVPKGVGWLLGAAGLGWLVAMPPIGGLDPIQEDLVVRWLMLGGVWVLAVGAGQWLWRRGPLEAWALGAGVVAVLVNLLAAGGIGFPAVALGLWTAWAVGLNLRDDRPCGRLREGSGRVAAFGLAALWAALLGTFVGQVRPYWQVSALLSQAESLLDPRRPEYDRAEILLEKAAATDKFSTRPWVALASLHYQEWMARGGKPDDLRWRKVPFDMYMAVMPPRAANSWALHRERARWTTLLLRQLGEKISPIEQTRYRANIVEASRKAVLLYPTNAMLRARLAEASAEIGYLPDAVNEGREALRLDALTPHLARKLDPSVRQWLESRLPTWEKSTGDPKPAIEASKAAPGVAPSAK